MDRESVDVTMEHWSWPIIVKLTTRGKIKIDRVIDRTSAYNVLSHVFNDNLQGCECKTAHLSLWSIVNNHDLDMLSDMLSGTHHIGQMIFTIQGFCVMAERNSNWSRHTKYFKKIISIWKTRVNEHNKSRNNNELRDLRNELRDLRNELGGIADKLTTLAEMMDDKLG
jgi:hypothetical protein